MIRVAIAFAAFIGVLIVLADSRNLGPFMVFYDFPYGDKVGHVLLYGILTLLINLAFFQTTGRASAGIVAVVALAMGVLVSMEELSQLFFPARKPDWFDLVASFIGVGWFSCLALFIVEWRNLPQTPRLNRPTA